MLTIANGFAIGVGLVFGIAFGLVLLILLLVGAWSLFRRYVIGGANGPASGGPH